MATLSPAATPQASNQFSPSYQVEADQLLPEHPEIIYVELQGD